MRPSFAFLAGLILSLQACSSSSDNTDANSEGGTFQDQAYLLNDSVGLERTEEVLTGRGSLTFQKPVGEIGSNRSYALNFSLNEGGSLTLTTQANEKLQFGVGVLLRREGTRLVGSLQGGTESSDAKVLEGIDASGPIALTIDVHNQESPSHILIWNSAAGSFGEDDALLNSEDGPETPSQGKGTFWGLTFSDATVDAAAIDAPKFVE